MPFSCVLSTFVGKELHYETLFSIPDTILCHRMCSADNIYRKREEPLFRSSL